MELSKSDILSARQCSLKLWLEKHGSGMELPTPDAQRRQEDGRKVGAMSRAQLGPNVIWVKSEETHRQAADTGQRALLRQPGLTAVEFPIWHGDTYARADALVPVPIGGYRIQETKAKKYPYDEDTGKIGKPDAHLIEDAAVQRWVLEGSGIPYAGAELNLIDGTFKYAGDGNYDGLFRQMDVSTLVDNVMADVPGWVQDAQRVVEMDAPPVVDMGSHCNKPYPCRFQDSCKKAAETARAAVSRAGQTYAPLTLLPDLAGKNLAKKLKGEGFTGLLDVPVNKLSTGDAARTALYLRIQHAHRTGRAVMEPGAVAALANLPYPHYYFDFEGIDLVIPIWEGVAPMEQVTFQWSCHIQREPGGEFEHHSFLDLSGDDPTQPCLDAMLAAMPDDGQGSILVYYATYERTRMVEMARRWPKWKKVVDGWIARMVDLHPIVKAYYYHPVMEGSFSIKKVLKALAPELDYGNLEEVQNGTDAQHAYIEAALAVGTTMDRIQELGGRLLRYCELDTWSMVLIVYALQQRVAPVLVHDELATV